VYYSEVLGGDAEMVREAICAAAAGQPKPVVASVTRSDGRLPARAGPGVPNFVFPDSCAAVLARAAERRDRLSRPRGEPRATPPASQALQSRHGAREPKYPPGSFFTSAGSLAALALMCPWRPSQSERPTPGVPVTILVLAGSAISCPAGTATNQASGPGHSHDPPARQDVVRSAVGDHAGCCMGAQVRADLVRSVVTLRGWHQALAVVVVDRFVDRATRANGAISAIGGTTPWYPCR
jgi:hypothetical protein